MLVYQRVNLHFPMVFPWFSTMVIMVVPCHDTYAQSDDEPHESSGVVAPPSDAWEKRGPWTFWSVIPRHWINAWYIYNTIIIYVYMYTYNLYIYIYVHIDNIYIYMYICMYVYIYIWSHTPWYTCNILQYNLMWKSTKKIFGDSWIHINDININIHM